MKAAGWLTEERCTVRIQTKPWLVWLTGCRHVKDVTNFPISMFGCSAASQWTPPWQNSRAFPPSLSIYSTWKSGGQHHFFLPNYKHKIIFDSHPALLGHDNIDLMTRRALSYHLIQFPHLQVGNYFIPFWHTKAEWNLRKLREFYLSHWAIKGM